MIDDSVKEALAVQLAADRQLSPEAAREMVDDVCERWQDSPHLAEVTAAYAVVARPVFDAIGAAYASGDPAGGEAVAGVVAALEAAVPQADGPAMAITLDPALLSGPHSPVDDAERETVRAWMRGNGLDPDAVHRLTVHERGSAAWAEVSKVADGDG